MLHSILSLYYGLYATSTYSVWGYLRALEVVEVVMEVTVSLPKLELL